MTFHNWADQDDDDDLVDTCGFLHTKTGEWKKGNCEVSTVEGTLCKAASKYGLNVLLHSMRVRESKVGFQTFFLWRLLCLIKKRKTSKLVCFALKSLAKQCIILLHPEAGPII